MNSISKIACIFITLLLLDFFSVNAQQLGNADSLKYEILKLQTEVNTIQLNLGKAHSRFKKGMLVATIGYSVTIAGGQMLGRKNDDLGKVLLYTGGAIGIGGTFMLLDSFKFLSKAAGKHSHLKNKKPKNRP